MREHAKISVQKCTLSRWKAHLSDLALVGGPIAVHGEAHVSVLAVQVTQSYAGPKRHQPQPMEHPG